LDGLGERFESAVWAEVCSRLYLFAVAMQWKRVVTNLKHRRSLYRSHAKRAAPAPGAFADVGGQ
jgi:hypothetical protein